MKRQIQKLGVRKWYADDFLKLQDELYKAIESGLLLSLNTNVILGGINIVNNPGGEYDITPGLAYINGRICYFDGIIDTDIAPDAAIILEDIETADKEYADGIIKATEQQYNAILGDITASNHIPIAVTATANNRLILPYFSDSGKIINLPNSSLYTDAETNVLATSKAVNDLLNFVVRKYFKENFNSGEIDKSLIPAGHAWLGKNGIVKIDDAGNVVTSDITALNIIADFIDILHDLNVDGDITADGNIETTNGKFVGDNAPKILVQLENDGALIASKGSVYYDQATDGGPGLITFPNIPSDAIIIVTPSAPAYQYRIARYTNSFNVETFDSANNNIDAKIDVAIYY